MRIDYDPDRKLPLLGLLALSGSGTIADLGMRNTKQPAGDDTLTGLARNVARCHANIAYVRYLQIRALEEGAGRTDPQVRRVSEEYRTNALTHSRIAEEIYNRHPARTRRGRAKMLNDRALLHFAFGETEEAFILAEQAYAIGKGTDVSNAEAAGADTSDGRAVDADRVTMAKPRSSSA